MRHTIDGPIRPNAATLLKQGDLRNARRAKCGCGHEWWAPVIGKCPRCGKSGAEVLEEVEFAAKRV